MIGISKSDAMRLIEGAVLVLTIIVTARATNIPDQPATYPDYAQQVGHPADGGWETRRVWNEEGGAEESDGQAMLVGTRFGVVPGGDLKGGGWSAVEPLVVAAYGEDGHSQWDIAASESEARGVYNGERTRWMPSKSRYGSRKDPVQDDSAEIPLQEHQRRQRLQLQQQLLKRAPEGRRGPMQLENLGGGILVGDDEEDEEIEEEVEEENEGERVRPRLTPPPQPFAKLPALRPPVGTNDPTPNKTPSLGDIKNILKMSGPLSLSEILQGKNLSLEELLRGSRLALSAVAQSATTQGGKGASRFEQRRRRPVPTGSRPLLRRRRPTPPPELVPDSPPTSTEIYTSTTQTTTQRATTTSTTTTEEPMTTTVDEPEVVTVRLSLEHSSQSPWFTSSGDPAKDILDIILQEDDNDGPSLAEVLSSRNMTVADLIEQRERASGRSTITSLFPSSTTSAFKEPEMSKGREKGGNEDERKGRKFARFDLMEADWENPLVGKKEEKPLEKEEDETVDQQVTQTRNAYQIIPSQEANMYLPKPSEKNDVYPPKLSETNVAYPPQSGEIIAASPPKPTETKFLQHPKVSEIKVSHTHGPFFHEVPTFQEEGHRPTIRVRVSAPTTTTEENFSNVHSVLEESVIHNSQRAVIKERTHEEPLIISGLSEGVKSAIIASTSLLGIALLIFLSIFAVFRYRQWRRRRGMGPYLCVAVLEAAAGGKKSKGPKIIKQGKTKEKGWGDTFDSAQERLWRTLRRGRCRYYDRENGQM